MIKKFTKDLVANIAQILVIVILLPGVCFVLSKIMGTRDVLLMLLNLIGEIDVFDSLMNFISIGLQSHDGSLVGNFQDYAVHLVSMVNNLDQTLFELLSIAICVKLFSLLWELLKWKGMPILASVVGVFLGCFIVKIYDMPIMVSAFLLLLVMVIDMIFVRKPGFNLLAFIGEYLKFCLEMTLKMLAVIFMTGVIAVLLVIWQGNVDNLGMAVFMIAMFAVPWFLAAAANRYLLS